jgi:hypothetical protein
MVALGFGLILIFAVCRLLHLARRAPEQPGEAKP